MSEFDEIALDQTVDMLALMAGVTVLNEWQRLPNSAVWMLRLRLELLGVEPTSAVPQLTEWELVVDFGPDLWGKVQVHPVLGDQGLNATFNHQQFNGGPHAQWPCRNGYICTPSWMSNLAKSRGGVQDEPSTTIERLCWHVARALEWLPMAATGQLTKEGDFFELPDFSGSAKGQNYLVAYYEDEDSYDQWQQQEAKSGIVHLSTLTKEVGVFVPHRFMDADNRQLVYEPAWGKLIAAYPKSGQFAALWIRLDAVPVVNEWQVPTTMAELQEALAKQGKDLHELLAPLWKAFNLTNGAFLMVGIPIPKRIGEAPFRYHWQGLELIPVAALKFPKTNKDVLKRHLQAAHPLRWMTKSENWHPKELQNRGRLSPALCGARVLVLGVGALGSMVAEQLVRMGVQDMAVMDVQPFEAGNLVRHVLELQQLYKNKAEALADRLNYANPSARVVGIPHGLPTRAPEFTKAAGEATLIIDATANDDVLRMMPLPDMNLEALFVSCSVSLRAEQLFFYAAEMGAFEQAAFNAWFEPFRVKQHALAQQLEMPRGAGCWHPLTPARMNRVAGLAGVAVELIEQAYGNKGPLPAALAYEWQVPSLWPAVTEKNAFEPVV